MGACKSLRGVFPLLLAEIEPSKLTVDGPTSRFRHAYSEYIEFLTGVYAGGTAHHALFLKRSVPICPPCDTYLVVPISRIPYRTRPASPLQWLVPSNPDDVATGPVASPRPRRLSSRTCTAIYVGSLVASASLHTPRSLQPPSFTRPTCTLLPSTPIGSGAANTSFGWWPARCGRYWPAQPGVSAHKNEARAAQSCLSARWRWDTTIR